MIKQPSNVHLKGASLIWRTDFARDWNKRYSDAQHVVNQDVLTLSEPFIPLRTGHLIATGKADDEQGTVTWTARYAREQYYLSHRRTVNGQRGSFWFHRMKAIHKNRIVQDAQKEVAK